MNETPQTVAQWAHEAFAPFDIEAAEKKLVKEVDELVWMDWGQLEHIGPEIADCMILLYQIADFWGIDIQAEVNKKMAINRGRTWEKQADGTYQHKEEK